MNRSTIFLYGPPASGKSTTGKILADSLHLPFHDLDAEIENRSGSSIAELFSRKGESGFRAMERQEIERLLTLGKAVIALGGGALTVPAVRALVEAKGNVVCLKAESGVLFERLRADQVQRPLLEGDPAQRLAALLAQRADHYASFAIRLDTTHLAPVQAAWESQILLGRFCVGSVSPAYEVCIQPGDLDGLGQALLERNIKGPLAVVADSNTAPLYASRVAASLESAGFSHSLAILPAGETNKTISSVQKLWENFLDAGLERESTVIALGGGVIGDLTGFAASTYMRGIRWVNVPTTLLAMVDSSLGGKTGVDLPRGKNLVGAFHSPAFVLVDPQVLATLPQAEFRSGLAEVVKHGIIADPGLLDLCVSCNSQAGQAFPPGTGLSGSVGQKTIAMVSHAMAVKIRVIETDPYEKGARAALNLGHSVGHALELVSEFTLRHGEAVAIGMVAESRLAERLGLADEGLSQNIATVLKKLGLPVTIPNGMNRDAIRQSLRADKKKRGGIVRFALPSRIGQVQIGIEVPDSVLVSVI